jgi:NitT/TauT family transport system ATP-binding protein
MTATSTRSSALLECRGISKRFGDSRSSSVVLNDIGLSVEEGEFVSLVGPSGCGKTTLLKILAGIISASSGTVSFAGSGSPVRARDIGMVFQRAALLPWRSVLSNVMLPADVMRLNRAKARERAAELLDFMQLPPAIGKMRPGELSGGMQQRVAIARALLHDPAVLMMDEPFGALDAMTREKLNLNLQDVHLAQRKTVVFVTHSIAEAVLLSDRVVVMHSHPGRVAGIVPIRMDRPRKLEDTSLPEFGKSELQIRKILDLNETRGAS